MAHLQTPAPNVVATSSTTANSLAFSSNVTTGSVIYAFCSFERGSDTNITFGNSGTATLSAWTELAGLDQFSAGDGYGQEAAYATVTSGGTCTVTATPAAATNWRALTITEFDEFNAHDTVSYARGTTANPSSGNATPGSAPCQRIGYCVDWGPTGGIAADTGDGWTSLVVGGAYSGTDIIALETRRDTSAVADSALFVLGTPAFSTHTSQIVFTEAAASAGVEAALTVAASLAGSLTGAGALTAAPSIATTLGGDLTSAGSVGVMAADIPFAVAVSDPVTMSAVAAANLSTSVALSLAGALQGAGALAAAATLSLPLSGTLSGTSALAAPLVVAVSLSGAMASDGDIQAAIELSATLAGALTATGALAAAPSVAFALAGSMALDGSIATSIELAFSEAVTIQAAGAFAASSTVAVALAGDLQAQANSLVASLELALAASATLAADGALTAAASLDFVVAASLGTTADAESRSRFVARFKTRAFVARSRPKRYSVRIH